MKDLFTYDNGKPLVSPWRRMIAGKIMEVERALDGFCCRGEHRRTLEDAISAMNQHLKSPTLKHAKYRLGLPDPWVAEVNERVQAIQATINLLTASGQL